MAFSVVIRPRYAEIDMQGVVFNAHWLTYFDEACTRFFESLGYDPKKTFAPGGEFDFMVVKAVVEWQGSAGFDDEVVIEVRASRLGNASFDLASTAAVDGVSVCTGTITYVSVVPGTKQSTPIPAGVRSMLEGAK
jgi:acyl-CoA thioester hydrolase